MNQDAVSDIARHHQRMERNLDVSSEPDIESARRRAEEEQARDLWLRLGRECQEYRDYYNAAIGDARVFCEVHDDTIVVRSHLDPQNTVALSRTPGAFHAGTFSAHRYRYPSPASDLAVALQRVDDDTLALTCEGQDLSAEALVLRLLGSYTEELVVQSLKGAHHNP